MRFSTSSNYQSPMDKPDKPSTSVIEEQPEDDRSPLRWWYRLTAPTLITTTSNLQMRELSRRGRLTSATLLIVILLVLAAEPVAIWSPDKSVAIILLIPIFIDIIALIFNRLGKITVAGILVIVGIEVGVALATLGPIPTKGGMDTFTLPQYDLLVQAEFVAVTLLPPATVFLMAGLQSAFIVFSILLLPHTPEFAAVFAANEYATFLRPITLQVIVALVTYMWVTSAYQAIKRADRAEVIAELERREVERQQQEIMLKQQLDEGIQQIMNTHVQIANGNFAARAPLKQENVLWRISYSLNNLLARLQSLNQADRELQQAKTETTRLIEAIHRTKFGYPFKFERTGTHLDPLILELASTWNMVNAGTGRSDSLDRQRPTSENLEKRDYRL